MNLAGSAIFVQLTGGTALTNLLHDGTAGVFEYLASDDAGLPYVIFQEQSATWDCSMGEQARLVSVVYLVKAVSGSAWPQEADAIDAQIDARLHDASLSAAGYGLLRCVRESDIKYQEADGSQVFNHAGGLYRVELQKS